MKRKVPSHITENPDYSRVEYNGARYMKTPGGWQHWNDFGGVGSNNKGGWVNLFNSPLEEQLDSAFADMLWAEEQEEQEQEALREQQSQQEQEQDRGEDWASKTDWPDEHISASDHLGDCRR